MKSLFVALMLISSLTMAQAQPAQNGPYLVPAYQGAKLSLTGTGFRVAQVVDGRTEGHRGEGRVLLGAAHKERRAELTDGLPKYLQSVFASNTSTDADSLPLTLYVRSFSIAEAREPKGMERGRVEASFLFVIIRGGTIKKLYEAHGYAEDAGKLDVTDALPQLIFTAVQKAVKDFEAEAPTAFEISQLPSEKYTPGYRY